MNLGAGQVMHAFTRRSGFGASKLNAPKREVRSRTDPFLGDRLKSQGKFFGGRRRTQGTQGH